MLCSYLVAHTHRYLLGTQIFTRNTGSEGRKYCNLLHFHMMPEIASMGTDLVAPVCVVFAGLPFSVSFSMCYHSLQLI